MVSVDRKTWRLPSGGIKEELKAERGQKEAGWEAIRTATSAQCEAVPVTALQICSRRGLVTSSEHESS